MMKLWRSLLFFLLLLICGAARAENFYIDNYTTNLQVFENRKVRVSEDIGVYFTEPSHGIIRSIPIKSSDIGNISVNAPFEYYYSGGYLEIKIGSPDELVSGAVNYHIDYTLQIYGNKPEFYYNLVGTEWEVPINKAAFAVTMPQSVNPEKVGLSIGRYGTRGFDGDAVFSVNGARIVGATRRSLSPHEGITLRVEVPEGYFQNVQNKWAQKIWIGLFLCTFLGFMIWYMYGKDEHVTPVVTFNAPEEINSVDADLIMNEKVSEKGLIALIVKLANAGYLKISTKGKGFELSDFKAYHGSNKEERKLLLLLSSEADKDGKVTDKMLKSSSDFYFGWRDLLDSANADKNKINFYEKTSVSGFFTWVVYFCIFGNIFFTLFPLLGYRFRMDSLILCAVIIFVLQTTLQVLKDDDKWYTKAYAVVIMMLFMFPAFADFSEYLTGDNISQVVGGMICILITMICNVEMMKPNYNGRMLKGKLLGLKKFIQVAEKDRLEAMVEENPEYFYKVLPYAYVLGVSKAWIKRFEGIAMPPPEWAVGTVYNINSFDSFTRGFQAAVAPSVENGGISRTSSSGGGGFSGGGFGGGGGRSW